MSHAPDVFLILQQKLCHMRQLSYFIKRLVGMMMLLFKRWDVLFYFLTSDCFSFFSKDKLVNSTGKETDKNLCDSRKHGITQQEIAEMLLYESLMPLNVILFLVEINNIGDKELDMIADKIVFEGVKAIFLSKNVEPKESQRGENSDEKLKEAGKISEKSHNASNLVNETNDAIYNADFLVESSSEVDSQLVVGDNNTNFETFFTRKSYLNNHENLKSDTLNDVLEDLSLGVPNSKEISSSGYVSRFKHMNTQKEDTERTKDEETGHDIEDKTRSNVFQINNIKEIPIPGKKNSFNIEQGSKRSTQLNLKNFEGSEKAILLKPKENNIRSANSNNGTINSELTTSNERSNNNNIVDTLHTQNKNHIINTKNNINSLNSDINIGMPNSDTPIHALSLHSGINISNLSKLSLNALNNIQKNSDNDETRNNSTGTKSNENSFNKRHFDTTAFKGLYTNDGHFSFEGEFKNRNPKDFFETTLKSTQENSEIIASKFSEDGKNTLNNYLFGDYGDVLSNLKLSKIHDKEDISEIEPDGFHINDNGNLSATQRSKILQNNKSNTKIQDLDAFHGSPKSSENQNDLIGKKNIPLENKSDQQNSSGLSNALSKNLNISDKTTIFGHLKEKLTTLDRKFDELKHALKDDDDRPSVILNKSPAISTTPQGLKDIKNQLDTVLVGTTPTLNDPRSLLSDKIKENREFKLNDIRNDNLDDPNLSSISMLLTKQDNENPLTSNSLVRIENRDFDKPNMWNYITGNVTARNLNKLEETEKSYEIYKNQHTPTKRNKENKKNDKNTSNPNNRSLSFVKILTKLISSLKRFKHFSFFKDGSNQNKKSLENSVIQQTKEEDKQFSVVDDKDCKLDDILFNLESPQSNDHPEIVIQKTTEENNPSIINTKNEILNFLRIFANFSEKVEVKNKKLQQAIEKRNDYFEKDKSQQTKMMYTIHNAKIKGFVEKMSDSDLKKLVNIKSIHIKNDKYKRMLRILRRTIIETEHLTKATDRERREFVREFGNKNQNTESSEIFELKVAFNLGGAIFAPNIFLEIANNIVIYHKEDHLKKAVSRILRPIELLYDFLRYKSNTEKKEEILKFLLACLEKRNNKLFDEIDEAFNERSLIIQMFLKNSESAQIASIKEKAIDEFQEQFIIDLIKSVKNTSDDYMDKFIMINEDIIREYQNLLNTGSKNAQENLKRLFKSKSDEGKDDKTKD